MKSLFQELLIEKWGKRKRKPNFRNIRQRYPLNAERSYVKLVLGILNIINRPVHRFVTATSWNRWLQETGYKDSAQIQDGYTQSLQELNIEMLDLQASAIALNPILGRKGLVASILNLGNSVDDIVEGNISDFSEMAIGRAFDMRTPWVSETVREWAESNFERIKTLNTGHISKLNVMLREGVAYGTSYAEIMEKVLKLSNMTRNHAKLIAVDQIAKLNGALTQRRQTELGLSMYTWRTAHDERVRPTHKVMDGLLCKWENPDVYSTDGGITWIPRPSNGEFQHPGQPIRCRCQAIAAVDDIIAEGRALLGE